ncbi:MAG: DUF4174 domain-containing protein [Janthinobacterium lividum]
MTHLKSLLLVAALLPLAHFVAAQKPVPTTTLAQTLRANRSQKRILLVGTPAATQPELLQQKKLLATAGPELKERDFLVLQLLYGQLTPADRQYWTQELKQSLTQFSVVLIGKDGGVKRTETKPLAPADLFITVDKMPMRQQEAQRQRK